MKTVRLALGMNSETLGRRLGISPQGVRRLEQSEAEGSISLNTLTKIANGLNCDVRYVLVPRISLFDQVMSQAKVHSKSIAPTEVGRIAINVDGESLIALASLLSSIDKRAFWQ